MKPSWIFLTLLFVFIAVYGSLAQNPPNQDRAFGVRTTSGNASKGKTFALLIGVNKYDSRDVIDLNFCVQDVKGLAEALKRMGVPEKNIIVMCDGAEYDLQPRRGRIFKQLADITDSLTEDDQLIFAFSGHGTQVHMNTYFCPSDSELGIPDTLIERKRVFDYVQQCRARRKFVLIDACRNEMIVRGVRSGDMELLKDQIGDTESYGYAFLASCHPDQKSFEDEKLQHGVFTWFVIKGLEGEADKAGNNDGILTLDELYHYVMTNTRDHVRTVMKRGAQVPIRGGEYSGEFVLVKSSERIFPDVANSLQAAIDQCPEEGTIKIRPGKYSLPKTLTVNKTINFIGMCDDPKDCVLELNDSQKGVHISSGEPKFQNISFHAPLAKLSEQTEKALQEVDWKMGQDFSSIKQEYKQEYETYLKKSTVFVDESVVQFDNCDFSGNFRSLAVHNNGKVHCFQCDFHDSYRVDITESGIGHFERCNFFKGSSPVITKGGNGYFERCSISQSGVGLSVYDGGIVHAKDCRIFDNDVHGIHMCQDSQGTIEQCDIFRNSTTDSSHQVAICSSKGIRLLKTRIYGMRGGNGVFVNNSGMALIEECEIYDIKESKDWKGVGLDVSGKATVVKCEIYDCENGIVVTESGQAIFKENKLNRNRKNWNIANADSVERINNVPNG